MADKKTIKPEAGQTAPKKPLPAPEQAAVDGAKVSTKNGTTHIENARQKRLADFKQTNKE